VAEPSRYTFGDTDVAARRLALMASVFDSASREFLAEDVGPVRPPLALDLGCGPGHTTLLLAESTGARRTVGLDTSDAFLARARADAPAGLEFIRHDATVVPFPTGPADVVYARLLLAHLPDPERLVERWVTQLGPGGLLALDEVDWIDAGRPVLDRYEEIVVALVASQGGAMYAGPIIDRIDGGDGWRRRSTRRCAYPVAVADAAAMYALNLTTWRGNDFVQEHYSSRELDELQIDLLALARTTGTETITWGLRQVVFERTA
jgi:SAM-dependent methyltransferase